MRSLTFFSTSRPDFALISSLLNLSDITEILRINLIIFDDVGNYNSIKNVKKIKVNCSTQVDLVNRNNLEMEISNSLMSLKKEDPNTWFKSSVSAQLDENEIIKFIERRNEARKNKDFKTADKIRNQLVQKNILLKDGAQGTDWELIEK